MKSICKIGGIPELLKVCLPFPVRPRVFIILQWLQTCYFANVISADTWAEVAQLKEILHVQEISFCSHGVKFVVIRHRHGTNQTNQGGCDF